MIRLMSFMVVLGMLAAPAEAFSFKDAATKAFNVAKQVVLAPVKVMKDASTAAFNSAKKAGADVTAAAKK